MKIIKSPSLTNSAQPEQDAESFVNTGGLSRLDLAVSPQRLLSLPGELRNQIYEYALTDENDLQCLVPVATTSSLRLVSPSKSTFRDFNELQYVCKQLYKETSGLELQYNTVVFYGDFPNERGPGAVFLDIVSGCSSAKLALLRHVKLTTSMTPYPHPRLEAEMEPPKIVRQVAEFCRTHTYTKVDYFPGLFVYQWRVDDFFRRDARLSLLRRNVELTVLSQYMWPWDLDRKKARGVAAGAPNFRFWPSQRKRSTREDAISDIRQAPLAGHERHLALTWFEEGI
jgi:hypothetical protein